MKIIANDDGGYQFERAFIAELNGAAVPVAMMGGVEFNIDTKPGPLADGLAFCQPYNPRLAQNSSVSVLVDRGSGPEWLSNLTNDPRIVAAARRFAELEAAGRAVVGVSLS
jgi:hypothetical protein